MEQKKFYQQQWFMWLLLIFLPPIGVIFMWATKKDFKISKKILLTCLGLFWWLLLGALLSSGNKNSDETTQVDYSESHVEPSTTENDTTTTQHDNMYDISDENMSDVDTQSTVVPVHNDVTSNSTTSESTDESTDSPSPEMFVEDVKATISGAVGKDEIIKDIVFKNGDLCVYVDFSQVDPSPLTFEDLAFSRTSSITDQILDLTQYTTLWNTITVDFGDIGYVRNDNKDIEKNEYGYYYFPYENFKLENTLQ